MKEQLLESIRKRSGRTGVLTADRYFRSIEACFEGGFCPTKLFKSASSDQWAKALKEAEEHFTYSTPWMKFDTKSIKAASEVSAIEDAIKDQEIRKKALAIVDGVLTTTKRDRDHDILETKGAKVDPMLPLLWQHISVAPIGKMLRILKHTDKILTAQFAIVNTDLGEDALKLIEIEALRISHGFEPIEWELLEDEKGWHFKVWEMYEASGVSCPSNTDAVWTAHSRNQFKSEAVRGWAKKGFDGRKRHGIGFDVKPACSCQKTLKLNPFGEEPDPLRWNRTLSKAFEVQHQSLQPATFIYGWATKFLECELKEMYETDTYIPSARMGSFLTALEQETSKHTLVDTRNIDSDGDERPPLYEQIQLNSKANETFLVEGMRFYRGHNIKFMVKIKPSWGGLSLTIYSPLAGKEFVNKLIGDCWQWAKTHNFLKGETFSLSGEFLPRGGETWADVMLEEKNQVPLQRCVKQINEKQTACANRGMILMGPPGTGKTLAGRIIKNEANASFIWISARDLHRSGAFGGFQYAFELAKEVAPAVLFVEDIDNFMDQYTVDLLKSQMDGIGRSSGIVTILTTNFPERLPEALIDRPGRFHDVLKFGLPTERERSLMLKKWLPELEPSELAKAVERTNGYSGAHIYELAAFAKTIREQDEIELPDAVTKALDKIAEQRELINESQLSGSNYRPRREVEEAVKKSFCGKQRRSPIEMCKCPECGHKGPMSEFMDDGEHEIPKSFDSLRKRLVMEAFNQPPEEIRKTVLSLQGVADLADARTEEAAWQSAFEEMGLE